MNFDGFLCAVKALNDKNYSFGNETLYKMARSSQINNRSKLSGAIWIIGRSYAASPQRRSYGGKSKIKTSNDGREGFFDFIAEKIDLDWVNGLSSDKKIAYDKSNNDETFLVESIIGVLSFNIALNKAIEKFDKAKDDVYCSNHISFCSKFLHFYYPNTVFIIDSYSYEGGKMLFNGDVKNKLRYICDPNNPKTYDRLTMEDEIGKYAFEEDVYKEFSKDEYHKLVDRINGDERIKIIIDKYKIRELNIEDDKSKASNYIDHCVRSYLLACKLKNRGICPKEQIESEDFRPMTRLVDTVFLNIKKKLSKKEKENLEKQYS